MSRSRCRCQRGRARLVTALRSSNTGLLVLALLVGAGAGGGAVAFRWLIKVFTLALSGHADYAGLGSCRQPARAGAGPLVRASSLRSSRACCTGRWCYFFAREARGHGVPEVMYAVARRGGRIAPQVAAVKALASALCIGGGGSVGREGPIVQIGSALGSTLGRVVRVSEDRMRVLVACGAAGGIAATFNAPLAGVFFAMELILRDFAAQSFGMVVLASVTASVIGRAAFGNQPFLHLPAVHRHQPQPVPAVRRARTARRRRRRRCSPGCCTGSRTPATGRGEARNGCGPRSAGSCSAACCWCCRRCTASATRCSATASPASTRSGSCSCC